MSFWYKNLACAGVKFLSSQKIEGSGRTFYTISPHIKKMWIFDEIPLQQSSKEYTVRWKIKLFLLIFFFITEVFSSL